MSSAMLGQPAPDRDNTSPSLDEKEKSDVEDHAVSVHDNDSDVKVIEKAEDVAVEVGCVPPLLRQI